jgi:hypothetical protein
MTAAALIERLERVRETGRGRWSATCPAHEDRSPSLVVTELDDGRTLLHCFGGCETRAVLQAVGLDYDALFPPRPLGQQIRRERVPFDPLAVLRAVAQEAWIAGIVIGQVASGGPLSEEIRDRGAIACRRLIDAAEACVPSRPKARISEPAHA